ncbi:MAG: hypothetical protein HY020_00420, partial [Burkholderiales bacterium]|nr:hypothetical protein [Burkholderiales bacterium]
GVISVSTAGGTATLRTSAVNSIALASLTPATDVGDTLATATNLALGLNQGQQISSGVNTALDVDLYRVDLSAGEVLKLSANSDYYARLRIFDATGRELSATDLLYYQNPTRLGFVAQTGGRYYIGISGYGNSNYNPDIANSGTASGYAYGYSLNVERQLQGASHVSGIAASATSGTPTNTGVASANTGQTITLNGTGFVAGEQLYFSILDDSGNLSELLVNSSSVAADGKSLTVVVPNNATTGRVRLSRDFVGSVLQIVPTLTAFTPGVGSAFTLSGSGFAEGQSAIILPTVRLDDLGRSAGLDVYSGQQQMIQATAPLGVSRSRVQVRTVGGISVALATGQP